MTRWRRRTRRRVLARRRLLAAVLAAVAALAAVKATAPPAAPSAALVVASRDLPAGERLGPGDLEVVRVAPGSRPARALTRADAVGEVLASPLGAGEPVTDLRLLTRDLLDTAPGLTAVPVRLPDAAVVDLLRVGDRVDVVATAPRGGVATTVAADVRVLAVPPAVAAEQASAAPPGRLVLLGTAPEVVGALAAAAARDYLTVVWSG
nr:SAF domain-containing protein [Nocardioides perillae]